MPHTERFPEATHPIIMRLVELGVFANPGQSEIVNTALHLATTALNTGHTQEPPTPPQPAAGRARDIADIWTDLGVADRHPELPPIPKPY